MGANHSVKFGVSETGLNGANTATTHAIWYASTLGEFMNNEVDVFTPWTWHEGMWEILHLFSRYNRTTSVESVSSNEQNVSAYTTINSTNDSITAVLVNRTTAPQTISVDFKNFTLSNQTPTALILSNLPSTETFISHTTNALTPLSTNISNNKLTATLPAMSVASVQLKGQQSTTGTICCIPSYAIQVYPNPTNGSFNVKTNFDATIAVYNSVGQLMGTYPKGTQSFGQGWAAGNYQAIFSVDNQIVKTINLVKN